MSVNAGVVGLTVGGLTFHVDAESATYDVRTRMRESITAAGGRVGRSSKSRVPFIAVTVLLNEGQSVSDLDVENSKVELRLADRVVTLEGADLVGDAEVDGTKNSVTVRFEGERGREVS
jgi:hypothetical protein